MPSQEPSRRPRRAPLRLARWKPAAARAFEILHKLLTAGAALAALLRLLF